MTQAEWKVLTQMLSEPNPTRSSTLCLISPAALLVNVIARIFQGFTPRSSIRYAMQCVSTLVFPEPAPANNQQRPVQYEIPLLSAVHLNYHIGS